MHKTIRDYLPSRIPPKKILIQARVDAAIVTQVKKVMKQENLSWSEVVTACLKYFNDDRERK